MQHDIKRVTQVNKEWRQEDAYKAKASKILFSETKAWVLIRGRSHRRDGSLATANKKTESHANQHDLQIIVLIADGGGGFGQDQQEEKRHAYRPQGDEDVCHVLKRSVLRAITPL